MLKTLLIGIFAFIALTVFGLVALLVFIRIVSGHVLDRATKRVVMATSSSMFREEITDRAVRTSMLEDLAKQMNRLSIPYFVPESQDNLALPLVIE